MKPSLSTKKLSIKHFLIFFIIANIYILLSNIPLFIHIFRNSLTRVFPLVNNIFSHDYYLYLSAITQGKAGFWLYREAYTTESINPGIGHIFYLIVGHFASIFSLTSPVAYHLSRILSVELFLIFTYILSYLFLGQKLAFFGGLFSIISTISPPFLFKQTLELTRYPGGIPWWLDYDALARLNGIPHHIFGQALLLLTIIFIIYYLRRKKIKYVFLASASIFTGGIIFPPILLPIMITFPLSFIVLILKNVLKRKDHLFNMEPHGQSPWFLFPLPDGANNAHQKTCFSTGRTRGFVGTGIKTIASLLIIFTAAFLAYGIIRWQENQGFPWNIWRKEEINTWNVRQIYFNYEVFLLFGLLPLFAFPSIINNFIKKKNLESIFLSLWPVVPFLFLPFANILHLPKIRLFQEALYVSFGILAISTISNISSKKKGGLIFHGIVTGFVIFNLAISLWFLNARIQSIGYYLSAPQIHIPKDEFATIIYIQKNLPKNSVILDTGRLGNIIPAFAPTISFIGHTTNTKDFQQKYNSLVKSFYEQSLEEDKIREFITKNRISYVYFGPLEKKLASRDQNLSYSFLKVIFQNPTGVLYQVKLQ